MKSELKTLGITPKIIGKTAQKRDVLLIQFGKDSAPGVFVIGNVEGSYYVGTELAMRLIRDLKAGKIDRHGKTIYIVPMPNPDAVTFGMQSPQQANNYNSNASDSDHDQSTNEDGANDLNKDGVISQMRVTNSLGNYTADEKYSALLKKIKPFKGESGTYSLFSEGLDDDNDDKHDEDGFGGVNINQNFTYNYGFFEQGAGVNQVSEPETKALADFIFDHSNILITVSFSSFDNVLNPWKTYGKPFTKLKRPLRALSKMLKEDNNGFTLLAESWKTLNKDWKNKKAPNTSKGSFHEWSYFHAGRWSISLNGWNAKQISLDKSFEKQDKMSKKEKLFHDAQAKKLVKAVIPWNKITHPDFKGKEVEVGGFHSSYTNNPAKDVFKTTKSSEYIEQLTTYFPHITISEKTVTKLAKNVYRVELTLTNDGKLPTQSEMGLRSRWMYPLRIVWNTTNHTFISGVKKTLLKPIKGYGGTQKVSWVINGKKGSKHDITIVSPVVGSKKLTVSLGE